MGPVIVQIFGGDVLSGASRPRPQETARPGTSRLAVDEGHRSLHDGGLNAGGPLHQPSGTARQVVGHHGHLGGNGLGIEDVEVGDESLSDETPVRKAPRGRRARVSMRTASAKVKAWRRRTQ